MFVRNLLNSNVRSKSHFSLSKLYFYPEIPFVRRLDEGGAGCFNSCAGAAITLLGVDHRPPCVPLFGYGLIGFCHLQRCPSFVKSFYCFAFHTSTPLQQLWSDPENTNKGFFSCTPTVINSDSTRNRVPSGVRNLVMYSPDSDHREERWNQSRSSGRDKEVSLVQLLELSDERKR